MLPSQRRSLSPNLADRDAWCRSNKYSRASVARSFWSFCFRRKFQIFQVPTTFLAILLIWFTLLHINKTITAIFHHLTCINNVQVFITPVSTSSFIIFLKLCPSSSIQSTFKNPTHHPQQWPIATGCERCRGN
nr:unnamed protein product [Digitaria exilis]CAB3502398.1 unnamed protein product [Digitaria exilis]